METRLRYLPIACFSTVMGLSGLGIALQRAGGLWWPAAPLGNSVTLLGGLAFATLVVVMHEHTGLTAYAWLAGLFIAILSAVVLYLSARTLYAVSHHQICVEER